MSTKFLSKAVAAAAFGGASLLIASPGIALAGDVDHNRHERKDGWVYAWPGQVSPGDTVTIVEICKKPQENPWVWSEATGKLWLEPRAADADEDEDENGENDRKGGKDRKGKHKHKGHKGDRHGDMSRGEDTEDSDRGEDRKGGKKHRKFFFEDNTFDGAMSLDSAIEYEEMAVYRDGPRDWDRKDKRDKKGYQDDRDRKGKKGQRDDWGRKHKGEDTDGKRHDKKHKKHPWAYFAEAEIPAEIEPGVYKLKGSCGEGKLIVTPVGSVDAGSGTTTTADTALLASGAGMVAAAVLGGSVLLRRRTADEFIA